MGHTEVKPTDPEGLNEQSGLAEKVQEEAPLGINTTSAEEAVEEQSVTAPPLQDTGPEAENKGKATGTNAILSVIPTTHYLLLLCVFRRSFALFLFWIADPAIRKRNAQMLEYT